MMEECWATFQPPTTRDSIVGSWVACIYTFKKKEKKFDRLFIGKVKERFLLDEPEAKYNYTVGLEIDCLAEKLGLGDSILTEHIDGVTDVDTFAIHNVICSGFRGVFQGGKKWLFPEYPKLRAYYEKAKKMDRQKMYNNFIKNKLALEE